MFNLKLSTLINKAKAKGACNCELDQISKYSTVEEAVKDKRSSYWIYWYLRNVSTKGSADCEPFILTTEPRVVYRYIKFIKKERWDEGEEILVKNAEYATYYAITFLKARWREAEATISDSKNLWNMYADEFGLKKQEDEKKKKK